MSEVKAGYKTTEFWVTLATMALGILVAAGIIGAEQAETIKTQATAIGELIVKLAAAAAPIVYILSRSRVKTK